MFCFALSLSRNVRKIPIKLESAATKEADMDRKFIPLGIRGQNIGSNAGLFSLLQEWRAEEIDSLHTPALLVDVNIYWRVMKVSIL